MARKNEVLSSKLTNDVRRLSEDASKLKPLGVGSDTNASLKALESLAAVAGRTANAERQIALTRWAGSPYYDLRQAYNQSKNVIAQTLTHALMVEVFGLDVMPVTVGEGRQQKTIRTSDILIDKLGTCESKMATLGDKGSLRWSQVNPSDEQYIMLWSVEPQKINGWFIPTQDLRSLFEAKASGSSVTGISLNQRGEYSIQFQPSSVPVWMNAYGGSEESLRERIIEELKN